MLVLGMARNPRNSKIAKAILIGRTPILPLRDSVHFPGLVNTVHVARERSLNAVRSALAGSKQIMVLSQCDMSQSEPTCDDLHSIGTLSEILQAAPFPDGSLRIIVRGLHRARALEKVDGDGLSWAEAVPLADSDESDSLPLIAEAKEAFLSLATHSNGIPHEAAENVAHIEKCGELADSIAHYLPVSPQQKQNLLETLSTKKRLEDVYCLVRRETHVQNYRQEIRSRADAKIAESQRDYVLREQLRCLQRELNGEDESMGRRLNLKLSQVHLPEIGGQVRFGPDPPFGSATRRFP